MLRVFRLAVFVFISLVSIYSTHAVDRVPSNLTSVDLIVSGRYVVTMNSDQNVIENGAVAIDNGIIVAVGTEQEIAENYAGRDNLDGGDRLVMPGLVNGHAHSAMTLLRGIADDLDLMTWLYEHIFPLEGQFVDEEFVRVGTELACWEMIRGGTTFFADMYFYSDMVSKVVEQCGLRAIAGQSAIDFPSPGFEGWDDSFASTVDYVKQWQGRSSRVIPAFALHAPYTVSPEHLTQALGVAKELDVPIMIHVAEDRREVTDIQKRYQTTSFRHLRKLGLLDHPLIAAHGVWVDEEEMAFLAASKTGVIHNPTSNLKTSAGIAPLPMMLKKGMRVGLGTDGAASNNDLDMWEEMRLAALLHKGVSADPTVIPAYSALRMATIGGAEALGVEDITGSLEVGKRADLIQVDLSSLRLAPLYDIISHLVYVIDSNDVDVVIVDGQVLMRGGEVLTIDEDALRRSVEEMSSAIDAHHKSAAAP